MDEIAFRLSRTLAALRPPVHKGRRWQRAGLVIAALAALALVIWINRDLISKALRRPAGGKANKEWVLVSSVDGPADDRELGTAVREMVSAALDQSAIVAPVPQNQVRQALRDAGRPDTTRVGADLARELAYRRSIRSVVEGSVNPVGSGYTIVLRVTDVEEGKTLFTLNETATSSRALVGTIESLGRRLRAELGERAEAIRASRPLAEVITPSFEAYRKVVQARARGNSGEPLVAIRLFRSALALDPDCATAWLGLGVNFNNMGYPDSAEAAIREALRRPERLTEKQRLLFEGVTPGDWRSQLAALDRVLDAYPDDPSALNGRATLLLAAGRYADALADCDKAIERSPFGPNPILLWNRTAMLVQAQHLDEAREATRALAGENARAATVLVELAAGEWARAESLGTAMAEDAPASGWERTWGMKARAAALGARGALDEAERTLRRAQALHAPDAPKVSQEALRDRLLLALMTGARIGTIDGPGSGDSTRSGLVTRGLWAVAAGDTVRAAGFLRRVRAGIRSGTEPEGAAPEMLEAWIAGKSGKWEETVRILAPAALRVAEYHTGLPAGSVMMQRLVAEAYENLGRPDSAAACYERVFAPSEDPFSRGLVFSLVHQRLVLLNLGTGRLDEARRQWKILTEAATRPDRRMLTLMDDARTALAAAE